MRDEPRYPLSPRPMASGRLQLSSTAKAPARAPVNLRLFDPRLTAGLRDERISRLRCVATRPPRHFRAQTLTARAAGRVFGGGDDGESGGGSGGRVSAWSTSSGALLCTVRLDASATCLAIVETVRPATPLRQPGPPARGGRGTADGFGCELLVWTGLADGHIAVLAGGDLEPRTLLGGHRGPVACICSPGAKPSTPAVGASVVLSGGEDGMTRMWDARTAECLRALPGGGGALRAILPVWSVDLTDSRRGERCRVWSADAGRTLCVWEPRRPADARATPGSAKDRGACGAAAASAPAGAPKDALTISMNADVTDLSCSSDGSLVCATAGADGALLLDANARLRSKLTPSAAAVQAITTVLIVGRGRQLWSGHSDGGVALWEREGSSAAHETSWSYYCSRRLPSPPLLALRPAATSQVWGAAADGAQLLVWMSEAAAAEASEALAKKVSAGGDTPHTHTHTHAHTHTHTHTHREREREGGVGSLSARLRRCSRLPDALSRTLVLARLHARRIPPTARAPHTAHSLRVTRAFTPLPPFTGVLWRRER